MTTQKATPSRREIIKECYERQLRLHGTITSHLSVRKHIIRPRVLEVGLSLLPLKFTSLRYPKPFDLYIKWYRLRHGTVSTVDYDKKMADDRAKEQARYRKRLVSFRCHQWAPDGPKATLLELARRYANAQDSSDPIYHRIKKLYLDGMEPRVAIEQVLLEEQKETTTDAP